MSKHNDNVYLGHILESIERIEKFVEGYSFREFQNDDKTVDAVIRNFEIIGEASNNISDEFVLAHPEINLRPVISFRNRLVHGYDDINLETVWSTIKDDLTPLKDEIEAYR